MASLSSESFAATRITEGSTEIGGTDVIEKKAAIETGTFLGEFPYMRVGNGPENLVILPGITLENEPPNRLNAWTYRLGFGRFAKGHTVYMINRRRSMPSGYTTRDMAADYARVLESELGPSHVIGFSTGERSPSTSPSITSKRSGAWFSSSAPPACRRKAERRASAGRCRRARDAGRNCGRTWPP
jgi:hypothetical protein